MKWPIAVLLVSLAAAAPARGQIIDRVEVLDFGTYAAIDGEELEPTEQGIKRGVAYEVTHLETGRRIVARIGTRFGFRYFTLGNPFGVPAQVTIVWKFPQPGVVGAVSGRNVVRDEYPSGTVIGDEDTVLWTFEEFNEIVPGFWTIEIWSGERLLTEQIFEVILPPTS